MPAKTGTGWGRIMAIRIMLISVAIMGGPLWWFSPAHDGQVDPIALSSITLDTQRNEFTVSNMEARTACLITRGAPRSVRTSEVIADRDCRSVWPGLADAANWTQNDDGTVVLSNIRGEEIMLLGLGDGVDYESLEPANAVLALTSVN